MPAATEITGGVLLPPIGKVKEIYLEIMANLGIDFVPNIHKVMASILGYLEIILGKIKTVMKESGKLDSLAKDGLQVELDEKPW